MAAPLPQRTAGGVVARLRRPRLVLGLGNPLMGDDGVGWHLVETLRRDPRLPWDVEVVWGGTDLLGCGELLRGRRSVVIVDAMEGAAGELAWLDPWAGDPQESPRDAGGAHTVAVRDALRLLRCADPLLASLEVRLLGVGTAAVAVGERLSPGVERHLLDVADAVLIALGAPSPPLA